MDEPRLFVSHAAADRDRIEQLLRPVRNLPIEIALAADELEPGLRRRDLEGQLANSDLFLPVLTEAGAADPLVNQEIGYAAATEIPVVPLLTDESYLQGYLSEADATTYEPADLESTVFHLLSAVRAELEPLGSLSTPNWFLAFECTSDDCGSFVELDIDEPQAVLWKRYEHDELVSTACPGCGVRYEFNPATLGFVRRAAPQQ